MKKIMIIIMIISLILFNLVLFCIFMPSTYVQICEILVNSIGMRLINSFNFYASSVYLHFPDLFSKWLKLHFPDLFSKCLKICLMSFVLIGMTCLIIKHWHNLLVEFFTNRKINTWYFDYPNWFSFIGFFTIVPPINLMMVRMLIFFSIILNYLFNLNIVSFYTWHINFIVFMLSYSLLMALITLNNKWYKYGYYTKFSIFNVGLSGSFLLFALLIKFGYCESHFDIISNILLGCSCLLEEFLIIGSKLSNYPIITNTLSIIKNLFNKPIITNILSIIRGLFISIMFKNSPIWKFYSFFKVLYPFNLKGVKLNVVENSDMSISNVNGNDNSNSNNYNNSNKKRKFEYDHYSNNSDNDFVNQSTPVQTNHIQPYDQSKDNNQMIFASNTGEKFKTWDKSNNNIIITKEDIAIFDIVNESITKLVDDKEGNGYYLGTKIINGSSYPAILRDRLHVVPFHVRISYPGFNELVKSNLMNDNDRVACYYKWCSEDSEGYKHKIINRILRMKVGDVNNPNQLVSYGDYDKDNKYLRYCLKPQSEGIKFRNISFYYYYKYDRNTDQLVKSYCYFDHSRWRADVFRGNFFKLENTLYLLENGNARSFAGWLKHHDQTSNYIGNSQFKTFDSDLPNVLNYDKYSNINVSGYTQSAIRVINKNIDSLKEVIYNDCIENQTNLDINRKAALKRENDEDIEKYRTLLINKILVMSSNKELNWDGFIHSGNSSNSKIIDEIKKVNPQFGQK